jgi:hypothetical protein
MNYSFFFVFRRIRKGRRFLTVHGLNGVDLRYWPTDTQRKLLDVRNQLGDILLIGRRNEAAVTQIAFLFASFACQDVAGKCATTFDLAGAGFLETLGCAAVGLDLWHFFSPLLIYLSWGRQS